MADTLPEIKHVVLLMLENRSFDHMLGGLPGVDGASAAWTNSDGERNYAQTPIEHWEQDDAHSVDPDPKHETLNLLRQLQNNNSGFVADPENFSWPLSGDAVLYATLGGTGTLLGPFLGAAMVILAREVLSDLVRSWLIFVGATYIALVFFLPDGLYPLLFRKETRSQRSSTT